MSLAVIIIAWFVLPWWLALMVTVLVVMSQA